MINYQTTFVYTDGVPFPNTKTINATGAGTADGTELVKAYGDNLWGITQALLDAAGLTPDSVTEAPGTSQILEAIRKISGSPGEGVIWWKSVDPSVSGDRVLLLNGQGILRASYPELDAAVYVGDPNNPTASAFYHADDAAGTIRNTAGVYLILPDTRGYALRGLDTSGGIDPDGAGRDVGSIQDFAIENITGDFELLRYCLGFPAANYVTNGVFSHVSIGGIVDTQTNGLSAVPNNHDQVFFDASTVVNTSTETRMINIATKFGIRY